jgi:Fe2+ or Zn2+ uptake regulation protein
MIMDNAPSFTRLRSRGYRLTPQRLAILEALQHARRHLSPAEIFQQVSREMPGLTEATVYRTLSFLVEQGLVLVAHLGHGQLVYEYADHDHHHLICRDCGKMRDVDHGELTDLYSQFLKNTGYRIDTVHATFFGLCPDCQHEKWQKAEK